MCIITGAMNEDFTGSWKKANTLGIIWSLKSSSALSGWHLSIARMLRSPRCPQREWAAPAALVGLCVPGNEELGVPAGLAAPDGTGIPSSFQSCPGRGFGAGRAWVRLSAARQPWGTFLGCQAPLVCWCCCSLLLGTLSQSSLGTKEKTRAAQTLKAAPESHHQTINYCRICALLYHLSVQDGLQDGERTGLCLFLVWIGNFFKVTLSSSLQQFSSTELPARKVGFFPLCSFHLTSAPLPWYSRVRDYPKAAQGGSQGCGWDLCQELSSLGKVRPRSHWHTGHFPGPGSQWSLRLTVGLLIWKCSESESCPLCCHRTGELN